MTDRTEVQFILESTTRCGGSCQGCILNADERVRGEVWTMEKFREAGRFIGAYLDEHLKHAEPKEISINLGQGDHLLAGPDRLAEIVRWMHEAGRGRAYGFMTASAIGRTERIAKTVEAVRRTSLELVQPVLFDLVIDPAKTALPKFRSVYAANIDLIRQAFGGVDLHVNVGPDTVRATTPEALMDFLCASGIRRFTLNLTPTPATAPAFAAAWPSMVSWICRFLEAWSPGSGVEINVGQVLSAAISGSRELAEKDPSALGNLIAHSAFRTIFIDGDGMIHHAQAGIGDVPFSDRTGFASRVPIPSARHAPDVYDAVARSAVRLSTAAFRQIRTDPACSGCEFEAVCPRIGAAAVKAAMGGLVPGECPSGLYQVLKTVSAGAGKGSMDAFRVERSHSHLPLGFAPDARPGGIPFPAAEAPLSFAGLSAATS